MNKENIIKLLVSAPILIFGGWMLTTSWAAYYSSGFIMLLSILTGLWILSLIIKDASIIDIFWGLGFVITALFYDWSSANCVIDSRRMIFSILVFLWGIRLSIYLAIRNIGKPEDYRYANWRKEFGKSWWWISYFRVFVLQGLLLWIISSLFLPIIEAGTLWGFWDYAAVLFWSIGFFFEAVGDWQMMRFKKDPENKGKVMDQGLWRYTRHPNYFGDAMVWWGYFFFALAHPMGLWFIVCPIIMTFFLLKVSGVAMLEENLKETKPKYKAYIEKTSVFFPLPPKE